MEPEVIAAIVGGGFTLIATLIASVYQIRASRAKQTPRPAVSRVDTPGDEPPASDAKPRPTPAPTPRPHLPRPPAPTPKPPGQNSETDDHPIDAPRLPEQSLESDTKDYEIKENDPDDPFFKTLPRIRPRNAYPRLRGKELDSQFLTDYTLSCRDGDRLEFSDGGES